MSLHVMYFLAVCVYIAPYSVKHEHNGVITHIAIVIHVWLGLSMYVHYTNKIFNSQSFFADSFQIMFLPFTVIYILIYM